LSIIHQASAREVLIKARLDKRFRLNLNGFIGSQMSELFTKGAACAHQIITRNISNYDLVKNISALALFGLSVSINPVFAQAESEPGKAAITIESISNSKATRGKSLVVTHYADEECGRRGKTDRVFKKNYAEDEHRFNPLVVDTDRPFIFQVSYTEKRRNETRSCAAISSVDLQADRSYRAVFKVVDDVVGCNISVEDVTDVFNAEAELNSQQAKHESNDPAAKTADIVVPAATPVVDAKPELSCIRVGKAGYKNGTPVYSYKHRLD